VILGAAAGGRWVAPLLLIADRWCCPRRRALGISALTFDHDFFGWSGPRTPRFSRCSLFLVFLIALGIDYLHHLPDVQGGARGGANGGGRAAGRSPGLGRDRWGRDHLGRFLVLAGTFLGAGHAAAGGPFRRDGVRGGGSACCWTPFVGAVRPGPTALNLDIGPADLVGRRRWSGLPDATPLAGGPREGEPRGWWD